MNTFTLVFFETEVIHQHSGHQRDDPETHNGSPFESLVENHHRKDEEEKHSCSQIGLNNHHDRGNHRDDSGKDQLFETELTLRIDLGKVPGEGKYESHFHKLRRLHPDWPKN